MIYDVIVVGAGLSGLSACLSLDASLRVLLISKEEETKSGGSSSLAQGGVSISIGEFSSHINDTKNSGYYRNNSNTITNIISSSPKVLDFLIKNNIELDKDSNGNFIFNLEAGHSIPRVLKIKGDSTGYYIINKLNENILLRSNIEIKYNTFIFDIEIDSQSSINGIWVNENSEIKFIQCNNLIMATGGIGQLFKNTTNPKSATGDILSLLSKKGVLLSNLNYIQFHPTGLNLDFFTGKENIPLITEALRGNGAIVVDENNNNISDSLSNRDVLAREIHKAILDNKKIFLKVPQNIADNMDLYFPQINSFFKKANWDLKNNDYKIPVVPTVHYHMGGVLTDSYGRIENFKNIFVIGESSSSGFHGANRLASNSLLECIVQGINISNIVDKKNSQIIIPQTLNIDLIKINRNDIKDISDKSLNIIRNEKLLKKGLDEVQKLYNCEKLDYLKLNYSDFKHHFENNNMLYLLEKILLSALFQKESVGAHFRDDYPSREESFDAHNIIITKENKLYLKLIGEIYDK